MTANQTLLNLIGAVVLLLWGTRMIRTGVMRGFGRELRSVLSRATNSRFQATALGGVIGVVLQSSTATALLVCSFVGRGALQLVPALAIMLGADLGASIAAQIFTTGIAELWSVLVVFGYVLFMVFQSRKDTWHYFGRILLGLGFALLALKLIGTSAAEIRDTQIVQSMLLAVAEQFVLSVVVGALLVWFMYSSLAAILLIASLAATGIAPPETFFGLVLGINIGAALPAFTATLGESVTARRVPLGNLVFRLLGVLIVSQVIHIATPWIAQSATDPMRQIVNLHLFFNIFLCAVMIAFIQPVAYLVSALMPEQAAEDDRWAPRNLDDSSLESPPVALGMAARETLRMGDAVESMLTKTMQVFETDDPRLRQQVVDFDDDVDRLHEAIKLYLTRLSRQELDPEDSRRCIDIITFTTNLEHVGDIVEKNLMNLAEKKSRQQMTFSEQGLEELRQLHAMLMDTVRLSLSVFMSQNEDDARTLIARKDQFRELELLGTEQHLERLRSGKADSIQSSSLHLDMIRDFKRINSHLTSVSYPILARAGALRPSRLKTSANNNPETSADESLN